MEQGELQSSPEVEIEFGTEDSHISEDEMEHSPEKLEVEEALDIKPPQAKVPKKKDKHKHKHDKKRSAEKERRREKREDRDRVKHRDRDRVPKEHRAPPSVERDVRREKEQERPREKIKLDREAREPIQDAREKIREQREMREAREHARETEYDKREYRERERDRRGEEVLDKREVQQVADRGKEAPPRDKRIVHDRKEQRQYRDQDVYIVETKDGRDRDRERGDRDRENVDDRDRDRKTKSKKEREEELKRREKSRKERERLERLEMERRRIERERQRQEQEIRDKHAKAERDREKERERLERGDHDREKRKMDEKKRARDELDRRRERQQSDYRSEKRPRTESPLPKRASHMTREEVSKRRKHIDDVDEDERLQDDRQHRDHRERREHEVVMSTGPQSPDGAPPPAEESSSGSDTSDEEEESGSDSDSGTDSTAGSEAEQPEHDEDGQTRNGAGGKSKSKFDEASDHEHDDELQDTPVQTDEEDPHDSTRRRSDLEDDLDLDPESPPMSPEEERLPELPAYYPAIEGCRNVDEFLCLNRIEEGTYGVVYRAKDKKTNEIVALKRLKMEKEKEGFPITSLREVNTLLKAQHRNIVTVREIVVGSNMDKIYIVMDYVEHDLKSLMESMKEPFMIGEVKTLLTQLLLGVEHLHDNWIIHRDLKTSNLLLSHKGILKIGDFGLAREYGSPLKQYTPVVVTLWYRSPELLLGTKEYSTAVDMWSVGCIFAELILKGPLFPGKSEIDQLNRIFKELGTPNEKIWSGVSELPAMKKIAFTDYPFNRLRNKFGTVITERGFNLMNRFLTYNPTRRISAVDALKEDYFVEAPLPVEPSMFPTWPAKSEGSRKHGNTPKPPSGGMAFNKLLGDDDILGGFHLSNATKGGTGFSLKF